MKKKIFSFRSLYVGNKKALSSLPLFELFCLPRNFFVSVLLRQIHLSVKQDPGLLETRMALLYNVANDLFR
ncbi:MAG: hypothetical protein A2845_01450 [Candidatus Lloydbacteria bacterium RIFCSPHIGHO2_01_FULL_49_22]|uniref:Uncharacterized protein n=1 Tax=Candidatus Lloydbacteria bacterium RIFCSPHIGHO2_01_FULL_49_22 TaxID=1798658 RepID=A0A1G2CXX3_9BACT|nr:MAG: hypothetical protein A2845_01450 [Candidatus Lloydbacteria bacterium RIFCSPHIGHO2_01_FULL_49_22]